MITCPNCTHTHLGIHGFLCSRCHTAKEEALQQQKDAEWVAYQVAKAANPTASVEQLIAIADAAVAQAA